MALLAMVATGSMAAFADPAASPPLASLLRIAAGWPLAVAGVFAAAGYAQVHGRVSELATRLRHGWWAAAPVDRRRTTRTLALVAAAVALARLVVLAAAVGLLAWLARDPVSAGVLLGAGASGLAAGTVLGAIAALRRRGRPDGSVSLGIREPWFALRQLDDSRLPHLFDWQRRTALVRWRQGGNFWMFAVALAGVPSGVGARQVVGLVLLLGSAAWLGIAVRASADAAREARRTLAPIPLDTKAFARATWRYPVFATLCAGVIAFCAILLGGDSWGAALAWIALVGLSSLRALQKPIGSRTSRRAL